MYKQYKCAWRHSNSHCILTGKPQCEGCSYFEEAQHKHEGYEATIQRRGWHGDGIHAWLEMDRDEFKDYTIMVRYCPVCAKKVLTEWGEIRKPGEVSTENDPKALLEPTPKENT
jgi:hypothetical protein